MPLIKGSDVLSGKVAMPGKLRQCGCGHSLGSRINGEHEKINGVEVCEDCYYAHLGEDLELSPNLPTHGHIRII
jgi:hypothetical protein